MKLIIEEESKISAFIDIFRNLKEMIDEMNIHFSSDGVYSQCLDRNHVALYELKLEPSWFKEYTCSKEIVLGINNNLLFRILNCYQKGHILEFNVDDDGDRFHISFDGGEDSNVTCKKFQIPLMDIDIEMLNVPDTDYSVDVKLETKTYVDIIQEMKNFHTNVKVDLKPEAIQLDANGEEGRMMVELDNFTEYAIEEDCNDSILYSLKYLHWMCSFSKLSDEIELHFSKDLPMKMVYNLKNEKNYIRFFLAPKIEDY